MANSHFTVWSSEPVVSAHYFIFHHSDKIRCAKIQTSLRLWNMYWCCRTIYTLLLLLLEVILGSSRFVQLSSAKYPRIAADQTVFKCPVQASGFHFSLFLPFNVNINAS